MSEVGGSEPGYQVGVLLRRDVVGDRPAGLPGEAEPDRASGLDGYDEAMGLPRRVVATGEKLAELGEGAVRAVARAVAAQVGLVAEQVAASLEQQDIAGAGPGRLGLDTVELTFGVTLTAGAGSAVNAFVTAEGETSFEVKISLSRRPG
jgi:hypothetical protein